MNLPSTSNQETKALARIDFDSIDMALIEQVLSTGSLDALPEAERRYYDLMELVRGLRARLKFNNKVVTKAGIIRLLKSEPYGLSDYMARRVYADSLNFFYSQDEVRPRAWSNFYAERLENWANLLFTQGDAKNALRYMKLAAELRGCFDQEAPGVPEELLNQQQTIIYTTNRRDLGLPATDRRRVEQLIDAIPEVPELVRESVKEDANISQFNLKKRMLHDIEDAGAHRLGGHDGVRGGVRTWYRQIDGHPGATALPLRVRHAGRGVRLCRQYLQ